MRNFKSCVTFLKAYHAGLTHLRSRHNRPAALLYYIRAQTLWATNAGVV